MPPAADQAAVEQPRKRQRKAAAVVDAADEAAPATAAAEEAAPARKAGGKAKAAGGGPSREFERELWQQGYARVAGVDEAGRGPLAGAGGVWLGSLCYGATRASLSACAICTCMYALRSAFPAQP